MNEAHREMLEVLEKKLSGDPKGRSIVDWVKSLTGQAHSLSREVKKQKIDLSTVIEIANQINSKGLDLARIEGYTITMMRGQFGVVNTFIMRQETFEAPEIKVTAPREGGPEGLSFSNDGPLARHLARISGPMLRDEYMEAGADLPELSRFADAGVAMIIPLVNVVSEAERELKGLICLGPKIGNRSYSVDDKNLGQVLGDMVAISLHNAQLYYRSIVDNLTQVYSRGHFDVHLMQEIARAKRFLQKEKTVEGPDVKRNRFVSLVMVDIDHFKKFNDTYGHQTGDLVLRAVAQALFDSVRDMDIVARYGGEEFALVFPETCKEDARGIAERLRQAVEETKLEQEGGVPLNVTISLGVATFPDDGEDLFDLVAKADQAMYRAKEGGRNRVEFASPPPAS